MRTKAATSGTCSTTSRQTTASKVSPAALQILDARRAIVDGETLASACRRAIAIASAVGSMPVTRRPEPGERLGDEAAAAADVEHRKALERLQLLRRALEVAHKRIADEAQPRRPLLMQRAELAVGVPPLAGKPLEALDLARVEVRPAAQG